METSLTKRLLKNCRQSAGKSTMDPRSQGDAATILNGKRQERLELLRPQGGDLCQERELMVGMQTPWAHAES